MRDLAARRFDRIHHALVRLVDSMGVLAVLYMPTARAQSPAAWSGPYNWPYAIQSAGGVQDKEISHAALIPTGPHAGKVLLFSWKADHLPGHTAFHATDTFWIFNADAPTDLTRLQQQLPTNLFCSGKSWDASGLLLVAGGTESDMQPPPQGPNGRTTAQTFKLDPFRLGLITYPVGGGMSMMEYDISTPPWVQQGSMTLGHWYPTVIPLWRKQISFTGALGSIPPVPAGGSNIVLGGPIEFGFCSTDGNEAFEVLPARSTTWRPPLAPPVASMVHAAALNGITREEYSLNAGTGQPPPSVRIDSYPRAVQLSNGQIYMAGDIDSVRQGPGDPDDSWVIKLLDSGMGVPNWQLHRASPDIERYYGSGFLMHMRLQNGGVDRYFHVGGSRNIHNPSDPAFGICPPPPPPDVPPPAWDGEGLSSVSELDNTGGAFVEARTWRPRKDMLKKRVFLNCVVLPTGQVLMVGGSESDYHRPYMNSVDCPKPVYEPELYDVGPDLQNANQPDPILVSSSRPLSTPVPPALNSPTLPTPRLYHSIALLLLDGRVLVAGGQVPAYGSFYCPSEPDFSPPRSSGEIFSPPYLFRGFRPVFTATPPNQAFLSTTTIQQFAVDVKVQPGHTIKAVTLVRPAAVTHHFDNDQRYIELNFSGSPDANGMATLTVDSPLESLAPPGYYILCVNEAVNPADLRIDWVPTTGHLIKLR